MCLDIKSTDTLGRVYTVHPINSECFHLRMLLHVKPGPTSFTALRTVNEVICASYKEACLLLGLLEDDRQWHQTLAEAVSSRSPRKLRNLFAVILCFCGPSNTMELWDNFKEALSEDFMRRYQQNHQLVNIVFNDEIASAVLSLIEERCIAMIGKRIDELGLPALQTQEEAPRELVQARNFDHELLQQNISVNLPLLNNEQQYVYDLIMQNVSNREGGIYFLNASGGTGKTFLINLLLARVRVNNEIAVAVASSGIAATLLDGGRTAHSVFKLPLNINKTDSPTCFISKTSGTAKVLQQCCLIVWDEITMSHKKAFEALDRCLKDMRNSETVMGGVTVLIAGDFRQTLPIVARGSMADEIDACIKKSVLWPHIKELNLNINMRVHLNGNADSLFADTLLLIGSGLIQDSLPKGQLILPPNFFNKVQSVEDLLSSVYPNLQENYANGDWIGERAVLAPRNDRVNDLNMILLDRIPNQAVCYRSIDTVVNETDVLNYTTEFLNSIEMSGVPQHTLSLKIGAPIILLRNLNPPALCNGTRLIIKSLQTNVIEATIVTGTQYVLLYRILYFRQKSFIVFPFFK